jgi:methyl-accepting chemotaxis protein
VDLKVAGGQLTPHQILNALKAFRNGDFSVRIANSYDGIDSEIADTFNEIVEFNDQVTREFERLSKVVGKDGRIGERGHVLNATGGWHSSVRSVNDLIEDMVQPTTEVARVIGAVAKGDLSQTMMVEIDGRPLRGEFLRIGKIVNTMVGQLASFASEVTRVAREVGTEGKLGGQARVKGVAGTWAWPPSLPSVPTSRATRVTSEAKARSWSTIVLIVSLSSRISPFTSTVLFLERPPLETPVVTSSMLRT